jgi:hypothetical protein
MRGVTRRRLLAGGGAAGAAIVLGISPRIASAAEPAVPDYLGRSSYMSLSTPRFGSNAGILTLESVTDLDPALAGSEDAFSLLFSADTPFDGGIRTFSHPDLGVFDFFIAPVEGKGKYEVVVNRSVAAPKHVPRQKQSAHLPDKKPIDKPFHSKHVKRLSARRLSGGVVCDVSLTAGTSLKSTTAWLTRAGRPVASGTTRHIHGKRVAVRMDTRHRPRGGHYDLTVATTDRHGHTEYSRMRIVLQ